MSDKVFNSQVTNNVEQANYIEMEKSYFDEENYDPIDDGKELHGLFIKKRQLIGAYVNHLVTRLIIILLIVLDIIFVVTAVVLPENSRHAIDVLDAISIVFVVLFLIELCLRIFVELNNFYKSWFNLLDGFIIVFSFIISVLLALLDDIIKQYKLGKILVLGRVFRLILLIRSVRIILHTEGIQRGMRLTVGGNKRRYQKDGYDLDLCYITSTRKSQKKLLNSIKNMTITVLDGC